MITKAGKAAILGLFTSTGSRKSLVQCKRTDGSVRYISNNVGSGIYPEQVTTTFVKNIAQAGVIVGTGNTPPTDSDYTLANLITEGLTGTVTKVQTFDETANQFKLTLTLSLTSSAASNITISEIGLTGFINASSTKDDETAGVSGQLFLIDRTVLDAPVTIEPSDTATIKYELISNVI